jgi:hypothetical protein
MYDAEPLLVPIVNEPIDGVVIVVVDADTPKSSLVVVLTEKVVPL